MADDSIVYVVTNVNNLNLGSAENFGRLKFINERYIFSDEIKDNGMPPTPHSDAIAKAVRGFRPNKDFLLIAGDNLQIIMMSAMLACRYKKFRVLRFDREIVGYVAITIDTE